METTVQREEEKNMSSSVSALFDNALGSMQTPAAPQLPIHVVTAPKRNIVSIGILVLGVIALLAVYFLFFKKKAGAAAAKKRSRKDDDDSESDEEEEEEEVPASKKKKRKQQQMPQYQPIPPFAGLPPPPRPPQPQRPMSSFTPDVDDQGLAPMPKPDIQYPGARPTPVSAMPPPPPQ